MPGTAPGMGLADIEAGVARSWAGEAVERLDVLHRWIPPAAAGETLREPLDHGGFLGRAALRAQIDGTLIDGLAEIADRAPDHARADVPVHADCHWGNWLTEGRHVTALLDFEWARFGEPIDDWFFLIAFSGPHLATVLDVVAHATDTPPDVLRAGCELREAAYLVSDLRAGGKMADRRRRELEDVVLGRRWWR